MFSRALSTFLKGGRLRGVSQVQCVIRAMSSAETPQYETLSLSRPHDLVVQVELNRPEKRNAMSNAMWRELVECFDYLSTDSDCRAVVVTGAGKIFTAGIDLGEFAGSGIMNSDKDVGRRAFEIEALVKAYQESFTCMERCPKPVIAAVHSACVGAGTSLTSVCDIRYCTSDAWFQIKEPEIGLAADVGALQRIPKIVGNDSLVRELVYTARQFFADEALAFGFVSRIFADKESMVEAALELASVIASKSPIAVQGSKINLVYSRDHSVPDGLERVRIWNSAMLQSEDLIKAAMASMQKEKATFSKL